MGEVLEKEGNYKDAAELAALPAFRLALAQVNKPVDAEARNAARILCILKKWDEACKVLDMCVQRSYQIAGMIPKCYYARSYIFIELICLVHTCSSEGGVGRLLLDCLCRTAPLSSSEDEEIGKPTIYRIWCTRVVRKRKNCIDK